MKKLLLAVVTWLGLTIGAHAQVTSAIVVASCGTPPVSYVVGQPYPLTMDTSGKLCNLTGSGGGTVAGSQSNASDAIAPTATNVPSNSYLWGLDINGVFDRIGVALANAAASATQTALVMTISPNSVGLIALGPATTALSLSETQNSQYPTNSVTTTPTPAAAKATGSTGAVTGTIAAVANATNYLCGFDVSYVGGAAQVGPITVTGLLGGTWTYQIPLSAATGGLTFSKEFTMCVPAATTNTAISVATVADATATAVDVQLHGYTQ